MNLASFAISWERWVVRQLGLTSTWTWKYWTLSPKKLMWNQHISWGRIPRAINLAVPGKGQNFKNKNSWDQWPATPWQFNCTPLLLCPFWGLSTKTPKTWITGQLLWGDDDGNYAEYPWLAVWSYIHINNLIKDSVQPSWPHWLPVLAANSFIREEGKGKTGSRLCCDLYGAVKVVFLSVGAVNRCCG